MPWTFLIVSIIGAAFTLNAFRPSSRWQVLGFSFFAAWLTGELVVWHIAWQVLATVVFIALGALDAWPGWLGLAITLASWCGMVVLARAARRSSGVFEEALDEGLGGASSPAPRARRGKNALPFWLHDSRVERTKDISYGPYGRRNRLDVYRPKAPVAGNAKGAPVLLQIHGGAWLIGDKSQQGLPLMLELAAQGWVCVAINYRLSPRATWPDHLLDCKLALAWVRDHIAEYGGDPDLVCVTGGSAGAHLATMVALTPNEPQYQPGFESTDTSVAACIPFYAPYDLGTLFASTGAAAWIGQRFARWVVGTTPEEEPEKFDDASPMHHLTPDAPPFFVIHGSSDNLVPVVQAREFVRALRAVSTELVLYAEVPGASHAFDVFHSTRTTNAVRAVGRFCAWIEARSHSPASPADAVPAALEPSLEGPVPAGSEPATSVAAPSPAP